MLTIIYNVYTIENNTELIQLRLNFMTICAQAEHAIHELN
jgi:hypothetical protein